MVLYKSTHGNTESSWTVINIRSNLHQPPLHKTNKGNWVIQVCRFSSDREMLISTPRAPFNGKLREHNQLLLNIKLASKVKCR